MAKNRKEIDMYDIDKNLIRQYRSISTAVDDTGYHRDTIVNGIITGNIVGYHYFKFREGQSLFRTLEKIDVRNGEVAEETDTIKMMADITGESYYKISSCVNQEGTTKEGYQYRWREHYGV